MKNNNTVSHSLLDIINSKFKENRKYMDESISKGSFLPCISNKQFEKINRSSVGHRRTKCILTKNEEQIVYNMSAVSKPIDEKVKPNYRPLSLISVISTVNDDQHPLNKPHIEPLIKKRISYYRLLMLRNFSDYNSNDKLRSILLNDICQHQFGYIVKLPKLQPRYYIQSFMTINIKTLKSNRIIHSNASFELRTKSSDDNLGRSKGIKKIDFQLKYYSEEYNTAEESAVDDITEEIINIHVNDSFIEPSLSRVHEKRHKKRVNNKWMNIIYNLCKVDLDEVNL